MLWLLRELHTDRANLLMNDLAAGLPSPLAFLGLADTLARTLGLVPWSAAVLPIVHAVRVSEGRQRPEMAPTRKDPARFGPQERPETLSGSVTASLLLDLPGCDTAETLRGAFRPGRLAGGAIDHTRLEILPVPADGSAFAQVPRGHAMMAPRGPHLARVAAGALPDLARMADLLFPAERLPGAAHHVPVAAGYHLLEDPGDAPVRAGTRDAALPHVFAEPVLGIAELVSVRDPRLTGLDAAGLEAALWRWRAEGSWVLGHPAYLPAGAGMREGEAEREGRS